MKTNTPTWNPEAVCAPNQAASCVDVTEVEGVIVVKEAVIGLSGTRTYVWKYDLVNKLCTTSGLVGDTPSKAMSESEVAWVRKHRAPAAVHEAAESVRAESEAVAA